MTRLEATRLERNAKYFDSTQFRLTLAEIDKIVLLVIENSDVYVGVLNNQPIWYNITLSFKPITPEQILEAYPSTIGLTWDRKRAITQVKSDVIEGTIRYLKRIDAITAFANDELATLIRKGE